MITTTLLVLLCLQTCTFYAEDCDSIKHDENSAAGGNQYSYVLKASPGRGIGVFALCDIPAGASISDCMKFQVRLCKLDEVPQELQGHCIYLKDNNAIAPERFDQMPIFWYINHSDTPNISIPNGISIVDGKLLIMEMYALKDIKAGDELCSNYNELGEPEESKEEFYRA